MGNPTSVTMKFSMNVVNDILQQNIQNDAKNMVISPLSIDILLNIIALGSKGATLKQLLDLVGCQDVKEFSAAVTVLANVLKKSNSDKGPEICSANALWIDQRFQLKKSFQQIVRDLHEAQVMAVDFYNKSEQVVKEANLWVEKQTKGLIKEILSPDISVENTDMLLANALYFKGTWFDRFQPENTKDRNFFLLNGQKVEVPFMNMKYTDFPYGTFENCQVLRMSYKYGEAFHGENQKIFCMYIILPKEKDGLPNLLAKIQMESSMFMDKIKLDCKRIYNLAIPKFNFDCKILLKETMMKLGLTLPFDSNAKDITEVIEPPDWLYVDKIIQKCHVEVDEEGTKAAAVTMAYVERGAQISIGPTPPPINFIADHPFMFLIREHYTGATLFVGTVLTL